MNNIALTQHLTRIEERLIAIEEALKRVESPSALSLVAQRLGSIDEKLTERVPSSEIRQAIEEVFETWGLVAQLKEVYTTQRDELQALVTIAAQLLAEEREHDATGVDERETIRQLLLQLRELGRKHVAGLADLERAFGWHSGDAERRKASGF